MYPIEKGFKMPPEWERHERTFMEWPIQEAIWPGPLEEIHEVFVDIAKKISMFEPVTMIARPEVANQAARKCGCKIDVLQIEHDDSWIRDNGPTFVVNSKGEVAGINWIFNAWGGKYPCQKDNLVAPRILKSFGIPCFNASFVMEGGSIHVDGEGTLLTTEECLLNENRNSDLCREQLEENLKNYLGIEKVVWLKKGLYGDDTDGHVDNVACFARPGVILIQTTRNPEDPNYQNSMENLEILKNATDAKGRKFEVIEIEQPKNTYYEDMHLTLSYINFYFVNGGIILPVFGGENSETDAKAVETISKVFPDRKIVTINGSVIARGGGNVHCATQQMPVGKAAKINL
ncbi:MAG: agmatine deiminase family protein [Clostridia bacterium]|nr:agmatine deiminase family protein [Clostridia bacterium]